MPKVWPQHETAPPLEQEFDSLWRHLDALEIRENRLRNENPDVPGPL